MCRITLDGQRARDFSTGLNCTLISWDQSKQVAADKVLNAHLAEIHRSAELSFLQSKLAGKSVSAQNIADAITGKVADQEDLVKLFDRYIAHQQTSKKARTMKRYYQVRNELTTFLKQKCIRNISGHQFNLAMGRAIWEYFRHTGSNAHNAHRKVHLIKSVLQYGLQFGYIEHNPLFQWKGESDQVKEIVALSEAEIQKLQSIVLTPRLRRVADLFLFQCFTGLDYTDSQSFHYKEHLRRDPDGRVWLVKPRNKNGERAFAPWLPEAEAILSRYDGQLLRISNQKYNCYLKEVARLCQLELHLTSHVGRKTFGMVMLNKGISIEAVSRMLGHRYITTTQRHYAQVLEHRVRMEYC